MKEVRTYAQHSLQVVDQFNRANHHGVNSLVLGNDMWHHKNGSSLVHVTAWPEPMMTYCHQTNFREILVEI